MNSKNLINIRITFHQIQIENLKVRICIQDQEELKMNVYWNLEMYKVELEDLV